MRHIKRKENLRKNLYDPPTPNICIGQHQRSHGEGTGGRTALLYLGVAPTWRARGLVPLLNALVA